MPMRNTAQCPSHPGEVLREDILPALQQTKTELAKMLGISRQHFYDIVNEKKPVSAAVAARLGKLFGNSPLFWIRMQGTYDAWHAEREVDVSEVQTIVIKGTLPFIDQKSDI